MIVSAQDYVEMMRVDGLVPGVGGLPWAVPAPDGMGYPENAILLLSFGGRVDGFNGGVAIYGNVQGFPRSSRKGCVLQHCVRVRRTRF